MLVTPLSRNHAAWLTWGYRGTFAPTVSLGIVLMSFLCCVAWTFFACDGRDSSNDFRIGAFRMAFRGHFAMVSDSGKCGFHLDG